MAEPLDVQWGARVDRVVREGERWALHVDRSLHRFDAIIVAIPAEQVAVLLAGAAPDIAARAGKIRSAPCWTAMASFAEKLPLDDALVDKDADISWAARDSAKPGRDAGIRGGENWVIQGSPDFSRTILECDKDDAAARLLERFFAANDLSPIAPVHLDAHRWRYAMVPRAGGGNEPAIWDAANAIGAAGDWLSGPRVENAWTSGVAAARLFMEYTAPIP